MAAEEKTEKATPKKRRDDRKEGHVFSSQDVIAVVSLLGTFYFLQIMFPMIYVSLRESMQHFIISIAEFDEPTLANFKSIGIYAATTVAKCVFPVALVAATLAIVATGVQKKFIFSKKAE